MEKDTFYFSHDYNVRMDVKIKKLIQKHGMIGYGIFWAIVEDLYNNANALPSDYESIAYDLRTDENLVKSVINDFDLFVINNEIISSESVERRLLLRGAKTDAARAAALIRWEKEREKKREKDANAMQTQCDSNAIKERKANENKENNIKSEIQKKSIPLNASCNYEFFITEIKNSSKIKEDSMRQYAISEQQYTTALNEFIFQNKNDDPNFLISYTDEVKHFKRWLAKYIPTLKTNQSISGESITISEPIKTRLKELYNVQHALSFFERYIKQYRVDEVQALKDFERAKEQQVNFLTIQSRISNNQKIFNY